ncbi:MAG: leucine-rich repeat protein [Alistipes sp.]|nr:leucine-rich repeat protein [Alistipes sp.]
MKKLFLLVATVTAVLTSCKDYDSDIAEINNRIDVIEHSHIASIKQQVEAINKSIPELEKTSNELKNYIESLNMTALSLQQSLNEINAEIDEIEKEIENTQVDLLKRLNAIKEELNNELLNIQNTISVLQGKDIELETQISELTQRVADLENNCGTKEWITETFATLEQYNNLCTDVTIIKTQIEAITQSIIDLETRINDKIASDIAEALTTVNSDIELKVSEITSGYTSAISEAKEDIVKAYTEEIKAAIANLDSSMKTWVNEQLTGYYTIAQMEGKIEALQNLLSATDDDLQAEIDDMSESLSKAREEITAAYMQAIKDAINNNNGIIDDKIAGAVAEINSRIASEVAALNTKIEDLTSRVNKNTADIEKLMKRIQTISYIPKYDDGKATVKYLGEYSQLAIDFEVSPKETIGDLLQVWESAVTVKAIYTESRANVEFIDLPIERFEADVESGIISIIASGSNLSEQFYANEQTASVRVAITDGNTSVLSEYIPIVSKAVDVDEFEIPNNEIWYTTNDQNIIIPTDSAGIISNDYDRGLGVIVFDRDLSVIKQGVLSDQPRLVKVNIPNSVHKINSSAFINCTSLIKVTIPNKVNRIYERAFEGCSSLVQLIIPKSVTRFHKSVFGGCSSLTEVYYLGTLSDWCRIQYMDVPEIPNSSKSRWGGPLIYGAKLYVEGKEIRDLILPSDITTIYMWTFRGCTSLESIVIPDSVTKIETSAFAYCSSVKHVSIGNGILEIPGGLFDHCSSLSNVTIPKNVISIGIYAFADCGLISVTLGENLKSMGSAFYGCKKLESIYISSLSSWLSYNWDPTNTFYYLNRYYKLFINDELLTDVLVPDNIKEIKREVFRNCSSIKNVTLHNGVTSIGPKAFMDSSLESIIFSDSVRIIDESAFRNCTGLRNIIIPANLESIRESAFSGCMGLERVYFNSAQPPILEDNSFSYYDNESRCYRVLPKLTIFVPNNFLELYKTAWGEYSYQIQGYDLE